MKLLYRTTCIFWIVYFIAVYVSTVNYRSQIRVREILGDDLCAIGFISYKHTNPKYYHQDYLLRIIKTKKEQYKDNDFDRAYQHFNMSVEYLLLFHLSKKTETQYLRESLGHIQQSISYIPDNPMFYYTHGYIYELMGENELSRQEYKTYWKLRPDDKTMNKKIEQLRRLIDQPVQMLVQRTFFLDTP